MSAGSSSINTSFGLIGLGAMGAAMLERALKANLDVCVYDVDAAAVERAVALGARAAKAPCAVADMVEVVFSTLPTPAIVERVALGEDGVIHGSAIRHYIDMSTIGPTMIRRVNDELGRKGIAVLDAPVSGGPIGVTNGTLVVMTAGPADTCGRAKPFFDSFARALVEIGDTPGQAQVVKLANNILTATNMIAVGEAMAFAEKGGIDPVQLFEVINAGSGRSWVSEVAYPNFIVPRTYNQNFRTELMHKDVLLCLEEADRAGVPMWLGSAVRQMWQFMMSQGLAQADCSRVAAVIEAWAGIEPDHKGPEAQRKI